MKLNSYPQNVRFLRLGYISGSHGQILVRYGGHTLLYDFRSGLQAGFLPVTGSGNTVEIEQGHGQAAMHRRCRGGRLVAIQYRDGDSCRGGERVAGSAGDDEGVDGGGAAGPQMSGLTSSASMYWPSSPASSARPTIARAIGARSAGAAPRKPASKRPTRSSPISSGRGASAEPAAGRPPGRRCISTRIPPARPRSAAELGVADRGRARARCRRGTVSQTRARGPNLRRGPRRRGRELPGGRERRGPRPRVRFVGAMRPSVFRTTG